jgi:hypothetical protein
MAMKDVGRQIEAEDLARARGMVQTVLQDWDLSTWNQLLDEDVVLTISLGEVAGDKFGDLAAAGGRLRVEGREETKRVLRRIYDDLLDGLSVVTEIVSGYDVALLGRLAVVSTKEDGDTKSLPIVLYLAFDDDGKVTRMTIAAADLQPLTEAIRTAVEKASVAGA